MILNSLKVKTNKTILVRSKNYLGQILKFEINFPTHGELKNPIYIPSSSRNWRDVAM